MFWLELLLVLIVLFYGAKIGDVFLGLAGGLGVAVLVFVFHVQPTSPPIDVMLIILSVVLSAAALQVGGGLDFLVSIAERILRKYPQHITVLAPLVTYVFTFLAGTGHVIYSLLPVIQEVAKGYKVRPERPISIAVVASQQAITASPISAAMAAMVGFMAPLGVSMGTLIMICVPATLIGVVLGALSVYRKGVELEDDPIYQARVVEGLVKAVNASSRAEKKVFGINAKRSVVLFLLGTVLVVLMGTFPELRPAFADSNGAVKTISMSQTIQILMLSLSAIIVLACKPKAGEILQSSVFRSGALAVICAFGLCWMSDTFVNGQMSFIKENVSMYMTDNVFVLPVMMFIVSALITSQAATTLILIPLALAFGMPAYLLIGAWPAVNGYFFFPVAGQCIAGLSFDDTKTTHIGKFVLNHSYMRPGLINVVVSVIMATLIGKMVLG
ncbi:MAG: anaerobic C4-dicarboxylate transporter family protein [Mitsuokella sp.]